MLYPDKENEKEEGKTMSLVQDLFIEHTLGARLWADKGE